MAVERNGSSSWRGWQAADGISRRGGGARRAAGGVGRGGGEVAACKH